MVKKLGMLLSQHINPFLLISQTIYSNTFARSFCPISPQLRTVMVDGQSKSPGWGSFRGRSRMHRAIGEKFLNQTYANTCQIR